MDDANELLNLRAIEVTTRSALGVDGPHADGVRERARALLAEVRARTTSPGVLLELNAVEARLLGSARESSGTGQ
jgi:hypothetical protein